jgi:hypothetical protein
MPSRRSFRSLLTLCLLCLFSLQALAGGGVPPCQHSPAASPTAQHHRHHAGMQMQTAMQHHDHDAARDLLKGCGCGCADRHCASSVPGLSAANLSAGLVAIHRVASTSTLAAESLRDAHDRDLIRPPSFS